MQGRTVDSLSIRHSLFLIVLASLLVGAGFKPLLAQNNVGQTNGSSFNPRPNPANSNTGNNGSFKSISNHNSLSANRGPNSGTNPESSRGTSQLQSNQPQSNSSVFNRLQQPALQNGGNPGLQPANNLGANGNANASTFNQSNANAADETVAYRIRIDDEMIEGMLFHGKMLEADIPASLRGQVNIIRFEYVGTKYRNIADLMPTINNQRHAANSGQSNPPNNISNRVDTNQIGNRSQNSFGTQQGFNGSLNAQNNANSKWQAKNSNTHQTKYVAPDNSSWNTNQGQVNTTGFSGQNLRTENSGQTNSSGIVVGGIPPGGNFSGRNPQNLHASNRSTVQNSGHSVNPYMNSFNSSPPNTAANSSQLLNSFGQPNRFQTVGTQGQNHFASGQYHNSINQGAINQGATNGDMTSVARNHNQPIPPHSGFPQSNHKRIASNQSYNGSNGQVFQNQGGVQYTSTNQPGNLPYVANHQGTMARPNGQGQNDRVALSETSNREALDDEQATGSTSEESSNNGALALFAMLCISLGANACLGWFSRGFYVRYRELADELRDTLTVAA